MTTITQPSLLPHPPQLQSLLSAPRLDGAQLVQAVNGLLNALHTMVASLASWLRQTIELEAKRILESHNISGRIYWDTDPHYGPTLVIETRLKASQALKLWETLAESITGRYGVWVAVTWEQDDTPKPTLIRRLARIIARTGIRLELAKDLDTVRLVREVREE